MADADMADVSFDIDGKPGKSTLFPLLLGVMAILCILLFFWKNAIIFVLMIIVAIIAFVVKPKKEQGPA